MFNGGIDIDEADKGALNDVQYLHVVNRFSTTRPLKSSSLVRSLNHRQTEFTLIEEDVDRYIQYIKDVAVYFTYLQNLQKKLVQQNPYYYPALKNELP